MEATVNVYIMLEYTPLHEINKITESSKNFYRQRQLSILQVKNPNKVDLYFRLKQLKILYHEIKNHENEIVEALYKDFHRSKHETIVFEIIPLLNNIVYLIDNLPKLIKPKKLRDYSIPYLFSNIYLEKISLGSILVISPSNFPFLLSFDPIAGAIAGGNSVVLKPSELAPNSAELSAKIIKALEPGLVHIVQGSVRETTLLLNGNFDKIFYTGSSKVGSIIAQEAAKSLTACVLELGGKSPAFITNNFKSDLETALKRIFFSSFGNSGQICIKADYLMVHETIYDDVISTAKSVMTNMWPIINKNTEYTCAIHQKAYETTMEKLKKTKGEKFCPLKDSTELPPLCIPPILISNVQWDDVLMLEENFAPVLPIIKYTDLDVAIDKIIDMHDTPLVQYIFSDSPKEIKHIMTRIRSGGCVIGDTLLHVGISKLPFGGIGTSGYGNYHGPFSFDTFTHSRTVLKQPFWNEFMMSIRYPPFNSKKTKLTRYCTEKKLHFF